MQHQILYKSNSSTADDIQKHLSAVDTDFAIKLSDRVDIHEYAHKLSIKSERIEAWKEDSLVGLLAYYNNQTTNSAYISNISVTKEFRSSGIASCLLEKLKEYIANHGITKIILEADKSLLDFYKKNDFTMGKQLTNNSYEMEYYSSNKKILVSICCLVYNHEPYLRDCFEGFVKQKTSFPIEILVHDDASTDHSADIIREYTAKYPDLFKPIYQTENQYSKGVKISFEYQYPRAQGKYIALCEGDDFWTDPNKLQRQFDQLEQNPLYAAVAENGIVLFTHSGEKKLFSNEPERDVGLNELLIRRRFPTASVMYRKELNEYMANYPFTVDTIMWGILSQHGLIHYSPIVSSVYRRGDGVTEKNKIQWAYFSEKINIHVNKIFKPNKKVTKIRAQTLYYDLKKGLHEAQNKHLYSQSIRFFFKMFKTDTFLFFQDCLSFLRAKK